MNFPTLPAPIYPLDIETEDVALRSGFENGSEQTRAKFTKMRKTFRLVWSAMNSTDRATLSAFWETTKGGSASFIWTDTETNTSYTVRFSTQYKERQLTPGLWAVEVELKEV